MSESISYAKTTRPNLTSVLTRERLFERLDRGMHRGGIWLSGPPGSGKTTLIASYLESRSIEHLWYQVDEGDADVATFFHFMSQAQLKRAGEQRSSLPSMSANFTGDVTAFARNYFRELYARLSRPFAIVLDNYQEALQQSELHRVASTALSEVPKGGSVVFVSRADPPTDLARLRANKKIEIIGWDDLRLTPEELQEMVGMRGEQRTDANIDELYEKTEGWAAGVVLMVEHSKVMGTVPEPPLSSTPQVVFDYLAGETFEKFEPDTQAFLLRIACLPQMTAEVASRLSGYPKAERLLVNLVSNDYFVTQRDVSGRSVFQLHPLLREFLLGRAEEKLTVEEMTEIRRQAGELLQEAGDIDGAIVQLMESAQFEQAMPLLLDHAPAMIEQGRGETLAAWLDELPPGATRDNPWLSYWRAASCFQSAPREGRRLFEEAYTLFQSRGEKGREGTILSCCGVIDSVLYEFDDLSLIDRWLETLDKLWKEYADALSDQTRISVIRSMYMSVVLRKPDHPDFDSWFTRAQSVVAASTDPGMKMMVEPLTAMAVMWSGHFDKALDTLDSMRSMALSDELSPLAIANLKNVESMYYMLVGDHVACTKAVEEGLEISRNYGVRPWSDQLQTHRVAVLLETGDRETADRLLDEMQSDAKQVSRLDRCLFHCLSAWRSLIANDAASAYPHQRTALAIAREIGSPFFETLCRLGWSRVLAACGDTRKAEMQIRRVYDGLASLSSRLLEFMTNLTDAQVALEAGNEDRALHALRAGMTLGREHGFLHVLWWEPDAMARLCAHALRHGIEKDYVRRLIRERHLAPDGDMTNIEAWPWPFKVYTLGAFELRKDDEPQVFTGRVQRRPLEMLKVLIALGGKGVRAEQISETMWPHVDGDYAYQSFTSTLHRLRRLIGVDAAITLHDGRVSLEPQYFWVDTWALDSTLAEFDSLTPNPRAEYESERLAARLLALYRGPFLANDSDFPCYVAFREHVRSKVLRYMGKLTRGWESSEHLDRIVDYCERAIEVDNLCEGMYRQLMMFYQRQGRRAEALDVYDRCCKTFSALLKATPSAETSAIHDELVKNSNA